MPEYIPRCPLPADFDEFERGYFHTAEWCGVDEDEAAAFKACPNPLWTQEALDRGRLECLDFVNDAGELLTDVDLYHAGHDFWLTRNRHGAGFWDSDRYYKPMVGEKLTDIAHQHQERAVWFDAETGTLSFY